MKWGFEDVDVQVCMDGVWVVLLGLAIFTISVCVFPTKVSSKVSSIGKEWMVFIES